MLCIHWPRDNAPSRISVRSTSEEPRSAVRRRCLDGAGYCRRIRAQKGGERIVIIVARSLAHSVDRHNITYVNCIALDVGGKLQQTPVPRGEPDGEHHRRMTHPSIRARGSAPSRTCIPERATSPSFPTSFWKATGEKHRARGASAAPPPGRTIWNSCPKGGSAVLELEEQLALATLQL